MIKGVRSREEFFAHALEEGHRLLLIARERVWTEVVGETLLEPGLYALKNVSADVLKPETEQHVAHALDRIGEPIRTQFDRLLQGEHSGIG